jgi:hypothetical protein
MGGVTRPPIPPTERAISAPRFTPPVHLLSREEKEQLLGVAYKAGVARFPSKPFLTERRENEAAAKAWDKKENPPLGWIVLYDVQPLAKKFVNDLLNGEEVHLRELGLFENRVVKLHFG